MSALGLHAALQDLVRYKQKLFAKMGQFCMGSNRDMDKGLLYHEIRYMRVRYKWSRLYVHAHVHHPQKHTCPHTCARTHTHTYTHTHVHTVYHAYTRRKRSTQTHACIHTQHTPAVSSAFCPGYCRTGNFSDVKTLANLAIYSFSLKFQVANPLRHL